MVRVERKKKSAVFAKLTIKWTSTRDHKITLDEDEEVLTIVQFGSRLSTSQSWKYALFWTRFIQVAYTRLSVGKFTADRILSVVASSGGCSISTKVTLPCTTIRRSTQNNLIVGFVVPLWNGKNVHGRYVDVGTNNSRITKEN